MLDFEELRPAAPLPRLLERRTPPEPAFLHKIPENTETDLVATWWPQKRGGNSYYRCEIPAKHLPGITVDLMFSALRRTGPGSVVMPEQRGETSIWSYPATATRGILMRSMQLGGFHVMIEVDDNYLVSSTFQDSLIAHGRSPWHRGYDRSEEDRPSLEAHREIVSFVDAIIVATEPLAEAYRQVHDTVHLCRNSIDTEDWPEPEKPNDGVFRIGYAGSTSHVYDFLDITRALSWAAQQPNVEVVVFGEQLAKNAGFPCRVVPWTNDLSEYRASLSLLDIGLCPLRRSAWTDCKSDLKALEYSMAGAAAVVSESPPYQEWVDTDRCLTARTPKEFLKHVKWLVKNQDAAKELAAKSRDYVTGERLIQHEIHKWEAACASPS